MTTNVLLHTLSWERDAPELAVYRGRGDRLTQNLIRFDTIFTCGDPAGPRNF